jgi:pyruvate kinase
VSFYFFIGLHQKRSFLLTTPLLRHTVQLLFVCRLDKILSPTDASTRKTRVVCTMGPSCWSHEKLLALIDGGMNVARLNFSHGDHVAHLDTLTKIRAALAERPSAQVAIMLDTKGPEIRTGLLKVDASGKKSVTLVEGQDLEIVTDYSIEGDNTRISCSYKTLASSVVVGQPILIADGTLMCTVKELRPESGSILVRVSNNVSIGEKKNMNLPGVIVDLPTITEKDADDLVNFGVKHGVDMIAASFVRKASDISTIRDTMGPEGKHIKIVAKIENQEGLHNYDEILKAADGIMVARGDLGMEIPIEKVFLAQKMMIRKANLAGKPVITATQMLESMIVNARPTRAECSDVANAVLDGTDAVMLSGETANGSHPLSALRYMANTCVEAESIVDNNELYVAIRENTLHDQGTIGVAEAVASSAVKTAIDTNAKCIIVCSETGQSARLIAKYRPSAPIVVLTNTESSARQVQGMLRGCKAFPVGSLIGTDAILQRSIVQCIELGLCKKGDAIVTVHGTIEGRPGSTNVCRVVIVE